MTDEQRLDLLTGVFGGASFGSVDQERAAWQLLRAALITESAPDLPWGFWRHEPVPEETRLPETFDPVNLSAALEALDAATAARMAWARRVQSAQAARR